MSTIAELTADRTVEGVYAVARKQRRTTRKGAAYLAGKTIAFNKFKNIAELTA